MATTEAVICVEEKYGYPCREGRQVKSTQAADDKDKGQQNHSQSAAANGAGLQAEITSCSLDQEASSRAGNEQSETIISFTFFAAISFVYGISPDTFWQIVADLRGNGKPINYETITEKCDGGYAPKDTADSEEDTCDGASGVSSNPSSTLAFGSLLSSVPTSEISPSHDYHQLNSATHKPPSTYADNSNADNSQSSGLNSEHLLSSLPTIPQDFHFQESKPNGLYNATEDGEDRPDGGNLESNDGLDRWLVSDFSNPVVHIPESNSEYMGSPVLSQTLSGLVPHVPTNTTGQNVSFHESKNDNPSLASLNPFGQVPLGQQNSVSTFPGFTPTMSLADGLSNRLNAGDSISSVLNSAGDISSRLNAGDSISSVLNSAGGISSRLNAGDSISSVLNSAGDVASRLKATDGGLTVSPGLTDIVCDGAEISRYADEPRTNQATESKPAQKPKTLTEAELFQLTFTLLEMEHDLLEKSRLCHGCHQKPREVTFLPCGHFITCADCAEPMYVCPLCEKSILATVNTFLS